MTVRARGLYVAVGVVAAIGCLDDVIDMRGDESAYRIAQLAAVLVAGQDPGVGLRPLRSREKANGRRGFAVPASSTVARGGPAVFSASAARAAADITAVDNSPRHSNASDGADRPPSNWGGARAWGFSPLAALANVYPLGARNFDPWRVK